MIIAMPRNEPGVHSRCPHCQTVFRVSAAQLKVRAGLVRCGRCQHAFRADQHLIHKPVKGAAKGAAAAARKRATAKKIPAPESALAPAAPFFPTAMDGGSAGIAGAVFRPAQSPRRPPPLAATPHLRTRSVYWAAGCTLLVLLFTGQALIFYGHSVARQTPMLRPVVAALCDALPCRKLPPIDMRRMDLVETRVAPHPRYDRALRVKATLVNRAESVQRYPMLEVSLIDSQGQLVARRVYRPQEYLNKPEAIQQGLLPQVAVNVQLDITSPGARASGYEVLLLPPPE
jgi:predicted Zn finger-like uncharacterized protein